MKFDNKYIIALVPLLAIGLIVYFFSDIVLYIVLAWVLSMLGAPLMRLFLRFFKRSTAAIFTLISFSFLLTLLVWIFVPPVVQQTRNLGDIDYQKVVNSIEEPLNDWNNWLAKKGLVKGVDDTEKEIEEQVKDQSKLLENLVRIDTIIQHNDSISSNITLFINIDDSQIQNINKDKNKEILVEDNFFERSKKNLFALLDPSKIQSIFSSLFGFLGNLLITILSVLFISFFFLREQGLFGQMLSALVPNEYESHVSRAIVETSNLLIRYFVGVTIQICIITIFVSLALTIFGIKNALLIGFFAALMNVIPYIGPIIGAGFGILITISSNLELSFYSGTLPLILIVIAVFMVMQLLDNFIVQPNIFSKSVKAHPLEIFIIVLVGAKLGGVLGMVIAIPMYTVIRVIAKVFLSEFKIVQRITRNL